MLWRNLEVLTYLNRKWFLGLWWFLWRSLRYKHHWRKPPFSKNPQLYGGFYEIPPWQVRRGQRVHWQEEWRPKGFHFSFFSFLVLQAFAGKGEIAWTALFFAPPIRCPYCPITNPYWKITCHYGMKRRPSINSSDRCPQKGISLTAAHSYTSQRLTYTHDKSPLIGHRKAYCCFG